MIPKSYFSVSLASDMTVSKAIDDKIQNAPWFFYALPNHYNIKRKIRSKKLKSQKD